MLPSRDGVRVPLCSSPSEVCVACAALADVNAVEVVGPERGVALGALPLTCVVARLDALEAEHVEALGQHGVLHPRVAARTREAGLREGRNHWNKSDELEMVDAPTSSKAPMGSLR